ncbi:S26 family signal peptidase [Kocuria rosea subsp. polaris]|uniref:Signal peptidase I n=1 Tax=Kocuria rosea subsp. polaris TaxID=136273 RepID=A0A0W8I843_KOCRO|nr:S26 family signal peptidase [Kocuria polaris]
MRRERQPRARGWRSVVLALLAAVLVTGLLRAVVVDVYWIGSDSMQPTVEPGDRVLVGKLVDTTELERGDLVVFDGRGSFAPLRSDDPWPVQALQTLGRWSGLTGSDSVYLKRVVGAPGDTVACCGPGGRLEVDGEEITEDYVLDGDRPSEVEFSVVVPEGRLWLMGDHRSVSVDSRHLLGAPGGGLVRADKVIGEPLAVLWPWDRAGQL